MPTIPQPMRTPLPERFWPKVDMSHDCWEWQGNVAPNGYGKIMVRNSEDRPVMEYAHRASWAMAYGPIPDGAVICHICDNPRCVRPSHLFVGTVADNVHDMIAKRRQARADQTARFGESNARAKLTWAQVREIRLEDKAISSAELARRYGVTATMIHYIRMGKNWIEKKDDIPSTGSRNT